jgi:glucose-6-phosphate 1-epimerase
MQSIAELNQKFALPDVCKIQEAANGVTQVVVSTSLADATIYLQGAHLASWTPKPQRPVLFLSSHSTFAPGKAIRGGVPVIFPWFGARDGAFTINLRLVPDQVASNYGYTAFELRYRITIGSFLHMELDVHNQSREPLKVGEALHSYYAVSDARRISVTGLDDTEYVDHADHDQRKRQTGPVRLTAETDRIFVNTGNTCTIEDPGWGRRIVIDKSGSRSTVVWNPWAEKAAQLADLGSDEWPAMVCVETANAADNVLTISPGQSHRMSATVRVEPIP